MIRKKNPYTALEKALGYRYRRRELLVAGLTHPSYRFENSDVREDNQRLEFLGDAVLDFLTAAYLYEGLDSADEGVLTTLRSRVASGQALARLARSIQLGDYLRLGRGEETSGGRNRNSNLADALEAVLGACYLDGGIKGAQRVFKTLFVSLIEELETDSWDGNPKGRLQELVQRRWKSNPVYTLVERTGPAHAARFTVEVVINGQMLGRGTDATKQKAECDAASQALQSLDASSNSQYGDTMY